VSILRNEELDYLKAINMIYIVGVIHTIFWWVPNYSLRLTFLLVEMIVVFFATGVSLKYSKNVKYLDYLKNKFFRIILPYIIFSIFSVSVMFLFENKVPFSIFDKNYFSVLGSWLNIFSSSNYAISNANFLNWHLWFIPVYIIMMLFLPVIKNSSKKVFLIICFFVVFSILGVNIFNIYLPGFFGIIYKVIFYLSFVIIGYKMDWLKKTVNY